MTDPPDGLVIQIASNDYPPFNDITSAYRLALQSLGREVQTIVLAPAVGEPDPQAVYLDLENSGATPAASRCWRSVTATGLIECCGRPVWLRCPRWWWPMSSDFSAASSGVSGAGCLPAG
jgi:hypothetical protein